MTLSLLYYITGHGYGHAMRSARVIEELLRLRDDLVVHIRTSAPKTIFDALGPRAIYHNVELDPGSLEIDALTINWPATLAAVRRTIDEKETIVAREQAFIAEHDIRLIAADIPFLAGYVAEAAHLPCWAIGNFTWDWIYQTQVDSPDDPILRAVTAGYQKMTGLLRLPFPHETPQFKTAIDVPLITSASGRRKDNPTHPPRILIAQRGGMALEAIERAVRACPEFQFIGWNILPPGGSADATRRESLARLEQCGNFHMVHQGNGITFNEVLASCTAVISKPGHGIVSDCIALGVGLLWPPRDYFREDDMLMHLSKPYLRSQPIGREAFFAGQWREDLLALLNQPQPPRTLPINGASVVAARLVEQLA